MDKNTIVVGIDHGWANMKTVSHLFTSGVKEITTEPALYEDVLEWEGKFYKIGGKRLDVKRDKVQDNNYYLLTLAALAKELEKRHQRNARVLLAVGLPLTRFGEEKDSFIRYLMREQEITFRYNKIKYHVVVERVSVYPQCYAAVADRMHRFDNKVLVVDIGSWTVDIMPIINHKPDESVCVTKPSGFITCIQQINKECVRQIGAEVDEYDIHKLLASGGNDLPDAYREIMEKEIQAYCQQVYHYIRELGYNMDLTPVIFVGGGAGVMKQYGGLLQKNITYVEDICANAKGYEMLGNTYLKGTITDVKYTITGAPDGLTVGEIKTDSSDIEDKNDLKKYDICVAQTNASKESSDFYLFCNEKALKKIQETKATIQVKGKAYADEKGGRKWTPTVISQQKITFLEEFNVKSDEATVKVTSNYKLGRFELFKTDKFTHSPVSDAKYYLYEDKDCDDLFCKLSTTNDMGLAATDVEVLTQDTYYLKEVLEPDGYKKDETVYPIDLEYFTLYDSNGKVIQQGKQMSVNETPEKVGVFVYKTDSDSGNIVAGAGFAVFKDAGCTQRVLTEGSSGAEVPVFYYDEDLGMAASEKFVKEQETYYVKEVVIPDGYRDDGTVYNVSPVYGAFEKVDATNTPIRCDVCARKEDKETGPNKDGDAKLSGALYGLYAAEEIKYPDGRAVVTYEGTDNITSTKGTDFVSTGNPANKDALLATIRTDADFSFDFGNLYYGNYYIKEIEASEGYLLDETAYPVNFKEAENIHQDISLDCKVVETIKKQPFEIIKVSTDGDNNETEKIAGAEFTIKLKSDIAVDGWDAAKTYDVFTTDEKGYARSKELPYGTYLVKETKMPSELYKTDDFEVVVTEDSREPQAWRILNDAPFKAYIRIVKRDAESGKTVLLSGATFKIKNVETNVYVEQKAGDKKVSEFITDETGTVMTPLMLKHGSYVVEEITAPDGYLISGDSFPFTVTKEGAVKVEEDIDGDPVIEVVVENTPVKGSLTIHKKGEVLAQTEYETIIDRILSRLTGSERGVRFVYEEQNLSGAVFHVIVEETVYTPDHQKGEDGEKQPAIINGIPAVKGAVVATLTTDGNGEAKIDGLPLGKYQITEVNPPKGFALCEEPQSVELSYADQNTEIVYGAADFVNARVKTEISLVKTDSEITYPVSGAVYGIYAAEDIAKVNGGELKPAQVASGSGADADSSVTASGDAVASDSSAAVTENKSSNVLDDEEIAEGETEETADSRETDDSEEMDDSEKDDGAEAEDDSGEADNPASQETQKPDGTQPPETESGKADKHKEDVLIASGSLVGVAETDENS